MEVRGSPEVGSREDQSPKGVREVRDKVGVGRVEAEVKISGGKSKVILRLKTIEYTGVVLIYL